MRAAQLLSALVLVAAAQVHACPRGYESPEALIKRARLVVELEVLSVSDVAPPPTKSHSSGLTEDDPKERKNARAEVKVIKYLKGQRSPERFTLIGGPYDTCAPFLSYLQFKTGERVFLMIDHELPEEAKAVLVNWRCRVLGYEEGQIAALVESARQSWRTQVQRHRNAAPEAFARAQSLSRGPGVLAAKQDLTREPYPVLACLRLLWRNPDELPPTPLIPKHSASAAAGSLKSGLEPQIDRLAGQLVDGVYHTIQGRAEFLPPALAEALRLRLKKQPKELVEFNQTLFQNFLVEEMFLPQEGAASIIASLPITNAFVRTGFDPCKCDVRDARGEASLESLHYAMALADDEPDSLVWSTFGLGMSKEGSVDPTYIAKYVEKNPGRDYQSWPRLIVLLSAPDVRISPAVERALAQEQNSYRLDKYLAFFLKLKQYAQARKALDQFERLITGEIRDAPPQDQQRTRESAARRLKEIRSLFERCGCHDAELLGGLQDLEKRLGGHD